MKSEAPLSGPTATTTKPHNTVDPQDSVVTVIPLESIRLDGGTQIREQIREDVVEDYAEALAAGAEFYPIVAYCEAGRYWLADGFHRVHAAQAVGHRGLWATVREGTRRDALLHAAGANAGHGLRRTNKDKRRAVVALLRDEEWQRWGDREIARRCAVSDRFVNNLRKELSANGSQTLRYKNTVLGSCGDLRRGISWASVEGGG